MMATKLNPSCSNNDPLDGVSAAEYKAMKAKVSDTPLSAQEREELTALRAMKARAEEVGERFPRGRMSHPIGQIRAAQYILTGIKDEGYSQYDITLEGDGQG